MPPGPKNGTGGVVAADNSVLESSSYERKTRRQFVPWSANKVLADSAEQGRPEKGALRSRKRTKKRRPMMIPSMGMRLILRSSLIK